MTRRLELLADLKAIRDHGKTPRIDTVHNRLAAVLKVLAIAEEEIDDLHVLAYERHTAGRELAVAGGERDYALDTHGDPRARDACRQLSLAALDAVEILEEAARDAIGILRIGERGRPRGPRTIRLEELAQALDTQARRILRGDYTPVRREPQPESDNVTKVLRKERDEARKQIRKLERLCHHLAKQIDRQESA